MSKQFGLQCVSEGEEVNYSSTYEHLDAVYHIAVRPPQFHTTVSFEQCSISAVNRVEGSQREVGLRAWRVQHP